MQIDLEAVHKEDIKDEKNDVDNINEKMENLKLSGSKSQDEV